MINVLRKPVAHFSPDFIIGLSFVTVGGDKPLEVGYRLNVPDDHVVWHV
jgi:hypothetical protein